MIRRAFLPIAALILGACATAPSSPRATSPSAMPLRFLLINDVYFGDTLRDGTAGLARVASLRDSLARSGPVTFVLAGDFLSPSLLSKWHRGVQIIEQFNAARLDYATFGNHEFELDRDTLVARIAESRFKWTSANCMMATGDPFPRVSRWDTLTISGTRVGLFGVTLKGDYRRYVKCGDPDSAARASIAGLKSAGAQLIIGLTHQSLPSDSALLAREPDLDFILGGHEHEFHRILIGGKRLLKADANSRSAQLITLTRGPSGWTQKDELITIDRRLPMDAQTAAIVRRWQDSLVKRLGAERIVATTTFDLDGRDAANRVRESPLGNVVTDAIRLGTNADVALMNAGTMRIDDVIPAGPITNYQLESIFLFPDESRIMTFPITGARIKEIIERGVSEGVVGRGAYLQVSGLKYRWDASRPSGSRIVGDVTLANGQIVKPGDVVRLSLNVYPACEGGDGYIVPEAKLACDNRERAPRAVDLLVRHITTNLGGRVSPPEGGRVTRLK
ncbi:MAG TPA: bifunctional UDP-sugar hydrolase/5'-nucleotidase [Gemmatimonadaceae bacterium]|nr:bifunctional UDP-sugar hydrolase/5'-nucleotidase [Gemmatimonadaceae bacterium]